MRRQFISAPRIGDINLNHHDVGRILPIKRFDVFVLQRNFVIVIEIRRQRCRPQRRKQRIFDGPKNGLLASVSAGKTILTRSGRWGVRSCILFTSNKIEVN